MRQLEGVRGLGRARLRQVVIKAGEVAIRARLLDTPAAEHIWNALPIYGAAKTWGKEVYFHAPVFLLTSSPARAMSSPRARSPSGRTAMPSPSASAPRRSRSAARFASRARAMFGRLPSMIADQLRRVLCRTRLSPLSKRTRPPLARHRAARRWSLFELAGTMHAGVRPNDD